MHRWYLVAVLLPALLGAGCGQGTPELPALAEDAVILAFGDSLTRGTGANEDSSYPAELQRLSGRRVINAGIPGEISAKGLSRLPGLLDRHRPDLLILCHGGNDFLRRLDGDVLRANLVGMIEAARQREVPVLLVGIPKPGIFLSTADIYAEVAQATGVPLEDEAFAAVLDERDLKADTVHPNAAGYRQVARTIHERLRQIGAI